MGELMMQQVDPRLDLALRCVKFYVLETIIGLRFGSNRTGRSPVRTTAHNAQVQPVNRTTAVDVTSDTIRWLLS